MHLCVHSNQFILGCTEVFNFIYFIPSTSYYQMSIKGEKLYDTVVNQQEEEKGERECTRAGMRDTDDRKHVLLCYW